MEKFTEEKVLKTGYYKINNVVIELPCDDSKRVLVATQDDCYMCNNLTNAVKKANKLLKNRAF